MPEKRNRKAILLVIILVLACSALFFAARNWSAIGSKVATPLRQVFGVRAVAQLETLVFNVQDSFKQLSYRVGAAEPESPFQAAPEILEPAVSPTPEPSPQPPSATPFSGEESASAQPEQVATQPPTPTPIPSPTPWLPPPAASFGDLPGEGVWEPYLHRPAGEVVAARTFLQPDPERPFALVAVAAFDLNRAQLHFVLGSDEPARPGGPRGSGLIPAEVRQSGLLLAAFNGGFIAEHGGYGAMQDGIVALAPSSGLATLAIFPDGAVRIGQWNTDLSQNDQYTAWRQNALMVIHNGEVNEKVYTGTYIEWGANLDYSVETVRSGIGLNQENSILYYFAGPSLSMPILADAMLAVGVHNGMLLDINPTHAHFTAIFEQDGALVAEPLFEDEMDIWVDRYLGQWGQDFFYVTVQAQSGP